MNDTKDRFTHHNLAFELGGRIAKSTFIAINVDLEHPIDIADNVVVYGGSSIGKYSYINVGCVIYAKTKIGRFCSIGRNIEIGLAKHPINFLSSHPFQLNSSLFNRVEGYSDIKKLQWSFHAETIIGNDVWIGAKVGITSGVTIGDGAVIAAGAIVTRNVEPYEIVGGVPAKHIGYRFPEHIRNKLLTVQWWLLPLRQLKDLPFNDIEACLKILEKHQENN